MIRSILRGRDYSDAHDFYCRCRGCKPPHPTDANLTSLVATVVGLGLLVLAIVVTL